MDDAGQFRDPVPAFRQLADGSAVADQLPFVAKIIDTGSTLCPARTGIGGCVVIADRANRAAVVYPVPARAQVSSNTATFGFDGMVCAYALTRKGLKLGCRVAAPRGPHTYQFPYRLLGAAGEWSASADGGVRNQVVRLGAPHVRGGR